MMHHAGLPFFFFFDKTLSWTVAQTARVGFKLENHMARVCVWARVRV